MQHINQLCVPSHNQAPFQIKVQSIQGLEKTLSPDLGQDSEKYYENQVNSQKPFQANGSSNICQPSARSQLEESLQQKILIDDFNISQDLSIPQVDSSKSQDPINSNQAQPKRISEMMAAMKSQIQAKIAAHNRSITNQLPIESSSIESCRKMLQEEFPNLRIDLIIKSLHTLFHADCRQQDELDEESFFSGSESNYTNTDYSKANNLVRQREAVRMPIEARLTQEKKIAISYLNHGYGVRILRQYIKDPSINPTRYNNVITTIMKLAFRKLQEFVKIHGHPVQTINSQDEKVIRAPLTNCQKWLPPDQLETFYKFIKLACKLQNKIDILPVSAFKLYSSCIRQLRQRQANQQDYRNDRVMKGARRMPKVTPSMYNAQIKYSQSVASNMHTSSYKASLYPPTHKNYYLPNQGSYVGVQAGYKNQNTAKEPLNKNFQPYRFNLNATQTTNTRNQWKTGQRTVYK